MTHHTFTFAALAALTLSGCSDKDGDSGGATTSVTTTTTTTTGTTGTTPEYFEPDYMVVEFANAIQDSQMSGYSYQGHEYPTQMLIGMIDSAAWTGWDDAYNGCYIGIYPPDEALALDSGFTDIGAWAGWSFAGAESETSWGGACDDLDPSAWGSGDELAASFGALNWGWGIGPVLDEWTSDVKGIYGDHYADYEPSMATGYLYHEMFGSGEYTEFFLTLAFEMNKAGEPVVDADGYLQLMDISGKDYPPDGYYSSSFYYAFGLQ